MAKTDVLWCASSRRQHKIPDDPPTVSSDFIQPVRSVRNLGIHLDSDLPMNTYITRTVSCCFAVSAKNTQHLFRRSVSQPVEQSFIVSLVISLLDNMLVRRWPASCMVAGQTSAAARLIHRSGNSTTWRHCCTTFTSCESLNESRITLPVLAYRRRTDVLHSTLLMTFTGWRRSSHGEGILRRRLWHKCTKSYQPLRVQRSAIAPSRWIR